jgi:hypothetical protein
MRDMPHVLCGDLTLVETLAIGSELFHPAHVKPQPETAGPPRDYVSFLNVA